MNRRTSLLLTCAALLLACGQDGVTHVRVAKSAEPSEEPRTMNAPGEAASAQAEPDEGRAAEGLQWALPEGWTQKRETGMRYATLKPGGAADVEVSVVVLPGPVGGELANVNRWRGQLGLAPIGEGELAALRKPMSSDAGPLKLFDLVSDGKKKSRALAAILPADDGNTWFVKMTGGYEAVRARQPDFLRLLSSLHFSGAAGGAP